MKKIHLFFLAVICQFTVFGQSKNYELHLSTGTYTLPANFAQVRQQQPGRSEIFQSRYFRYIQFTGLPSAEQRAAMEKAGVSLMMYLPDNVYIASIRQGITASVLSAYSVRGVHVIAAKFKMLKELQDAISQDAFPHYALKGNRVGISITCHQNLDHARIRSWLKSRGYQVTEDDATANSFSVWIKKSQLNNFISLPFVNSAELVDDAPQPDNQVGRTDIRSNAIYTEYSGGRKYNGAGVNVALQDDGIIGPHIDYQGRISNQFLVTNNGNHGDHCSGILMGAGNRDPVARGMAWGANIHIYAAAGYQAFTQIPTHYNTLGIRIISTSYSDGCNTGYTTRAQQLDMQALSLPQLVQVFSAGNNGTSDCGYGAGSGWGNVTGGHKHSKNSISVANLDYIDARNSSSSRGPAHDGRLKPEVSAVGTNVYSTIDPNAYLSQTGTSMSCPAVAGLFAQLYQAYKNLNNNNNPAGALMKAIVMNTADDIGNPGPDFGHGYGRVNGLKAVKAMEQGAYTTGTVSNAGTTTHTIVVPAGVRRIKVMTYWHDFQASVGAGVALVNNLNTTLTDPSSAVYNPLVLNIAPNATSLNANAVPGIDNRNNHEQITINNPTAGNYVLSVNGFSVPMGPQSYYVTWIFETDGYTITYPMGGEGFVPGLTETIRWEAFETSGNQTLEYTTNNGTTWNLVNANIPGSQRYYDMTVPVNVVSGKCRVRISRGIYNAESDTNFSIIGTPANLRVSWSCTDSVRLSWNPVAGATAYDVFKLGTTYMDSVATTTNTTCVVPNVPIGQATWFSVRSRGPLDAVGRRAVAVQKVPGAFNCPQLATDLACERIVNPSGTMSDCYNLVNVPVVVKLYNPGMTPVSNVPVFYRLAGGALQSETYLGTISPSASVNYTFSARVNLSAPGTYTIKTWCAFTTDPHQLNDTLVGRVVVGPGVLKTLPVTEDFESFTNCSTVNYCPLICPLANDFVNETNQVVDLLDWRTNSGPGPNAGTGPQQDFQPGTASGKYVYLESSAPCSSVFAHLSSPCINLGTVNNPSLSFAYHMNGANMGSLYLDIFDGSVWNESVWSMSGDQGTNWKVAGVSLAPWAGDTITFRWRGVSGGVMSNMAIDGINISGNLVGINETEASNQFKVYPNPAAGEFNIEIPVGFKGDLSCEVTDLSGRVLYNGKAEAGQKSTTINLRQYAAGVYLLKVTCEDKVEYTRLYKM